MFDLPSPTQYLGAKNKINIHVKRDDLIHPIVSGNKWRKLKFQIQGIIENDQKGLITYGGAYSNHILATAAAGQYFKLPTIGIIRGEATSISNPTLSKAVALGMTLHFVNRSDYKIKEQALSVQEIIQAHLDYALIPEGGKHQLAFPGIAEILAECTAQLDCVPHYFVVAIGTGTTFSGLLTALPIGAKLIGIPVLKHKKIESEICEILEMDRLPNQGVLIHDYHFGGYAKCKPELVEFKNQIFAEYGLQTDLVYTSKVFYAVWDLIEKNYFPIGSNVVVIHTGGLQGNEGMKERFPNSKI